MTPPIWGMLWDGRKWGMEEIVLQISSFSNVPTYLTISNDYCSLFPLVFNKWLRSKILWLNRRTLVQAKSKKHCFMVALALKVENKRIINVALISFKYLFISAISAEFANVEICEIQWSYLPAVMWHIGLYIDLNNRKTW